MVGGSNGKKDFFFVSFSVISAVSILDSIFNCGCVTARLHRMVRTLDLVSLYWLRHAKCG